MDHNRKVTGDRFSYYHCYSCGLLFLHPVPADLGSFYPKDYYSIPRSLDEVSRAAELERYKIDIVRKFATTGRLLEIGPSYGSFLYLAKQANFTAEAVEMDPECCSFIRDVIGVPVVQSNDPMRTILDMGSFDVMALWHVIEHIPEPWSTLGAAADRLKPGGILVIAAPNPLAMQFRILGRFWPHVDAPRHVVLIPEQLLTSRLESMGLHRIWFTTNDKGSKGWNVFGWEFFFANMTANRYLKFGLRIFGRFFAILMGPFERTEGKGSAYTIVYRKEP